MYEIENIPLPAKLTTYKTSEFSALCAKLDPGQSFVMPRTDFHERIHPKLYALGKRLKRRFGVRKLDNGDYRIGRIE